jgi:hypothetical protein
LSTKVARLLGSLPPKIRAMLNSEWLPHTMQTSSGLSLMTSNSAHNTAFCSAVRSCGNNYLGSFQRT